MAFQPSNFERDEFLFGELKKQTQEKCGHRTVPCSLQFPLSCLSYILYVFDYCYVFSALSFVIDVSSHVPVSVEEHVTMARIFSIEPEFGSQESRCSWLWLLVFDRTRRCGI
jgi:hypothetical protein